MNYPFLERFNHIEESGLEIGTCLCQKLSFRDSVGFLTSDGGDRIGEFMDLQMMIRVRVRVRVRVRSPNDD